MGTPASASTCVTGPACTATLLRAQEALGKSAGAAPLRTHKKHPCTTGPGAVDAATQPAHPGNGIRFNVQFTCCRPNPEDPSQAQWKPDKARTEERVSEKRSEGDKKCEGAHAAGVRGRGSGQLPWAARAH